MSEHMAPTVEPSMFVSHGRHGMENRNIDIISLIYFK